ncbi:SPX domain-containing protein 2 [Asimina triloba]
MIILFSPPPSPPPRGQVHKSHSPRCSTDRYSRLSSSPPSMKFGKLLKSQVEETLPEWRDKFISYKELKQLLKQIEPRDERGQPRSASDGTDGGDSIRKEEADFIRQVYVQIEKLNYFFVEQEETYIIKQKELQDAAETAKDSPAEMMHIWKEVVDFHGETVLLENYSALNYTGLVKILKKYEKRTGAPIRLPFIQRILQQPFFATDVLNKLIKECEAMLDRLFPASESSISNPHVEGHELNPTAERSSLLNWPEELEEIKFPEELEEIKFMENLYAKSTMAALRILKEIRSGSSTVSVFSLPPLQGGLGEEPW